MMIPREKGVLICVVVMLILPAVVHAETDITKGRFRLELSGLGVIDAPGANDDNYMATFMGEYEFPVFPHGMIGFRVCPAFVYPGSETVYGVGGGVDMRVYQRDTTFDGFFGEIGLTPLWLTDTFNDNTSRVQFLVDLGIGYKFPDSPWSIALKGQHVSNASLGDRNASINGVGLSVGFTFK